MTTKRYETVKRYKRVIDAEVDRLKLEAAGIYSLILDSQFTSLYPLWSGLFEVRLQVPFEDSEKACKFLSDESSDNNDLLSADPDENEANIQLCMDRLRTVGKLGIWVKIFIVSILLSYLMSDEILEDSLYFFQHLLYILGF